MARTKEYGHYCLVARSLETVGDKWSLLIVRDLLFGPQRFSDLLYSVAGITPKWLTQRLRDLEAAGVLERDESPDRPDRREVWYRLTQKGQDLRPVIQALTMWGLDYARPPEPGEIIRPERAVATTATILTRKGVVLPRPAAWWFRVDGRGVGILGFDGERWTYRPDPDGAIPHDLVVETTTDYWARLLLTPMAERPAYLAAVELSGDQERIDDFLAAFIRPPAEAVTTTS
jgi:DNA-binding HxlR family transcriptional regulator